MKLTHTIRTFHSVESKSIDLFINQLKASVKDGATHVLISHDRNTDGNHVCYNFKCVKTYSQEEIINNELTELRGKIEKLEQLKQKKNDKV